MEEKLTFKIGEKGGVSVYGLGQFPVTLYVRSMDSIARRFKGVVRFFRSAQA